MGFASITRLKLEGKLVYLTQMYRAVCFFQMGDFFNFPNLGCRVKKYCFNIRTNREAIIFSKLLISF